MLFNSQGFLANILIQIVREGKRDRSLRGNLRLSFLLKLRVKLA